MKLVGTGGYNNNLLGQNNSNNYVFLEVRKMKKLLSKTQGILENLPGNSAE